MRILGLDYGAKTMGVAVSDPLLITAQGLEIIRRDAENKLRRTFARIEQLVAEYEVDTIVLGYPRHMNNDEGIRCEKTKEVAQALERRTGCRVILWDERRTSVEAHRAMAEGHISRERKKALVDRIAAELILQNYLDYLSNA